MINRLIELIIRDITEEDLQQVASIHQKAFPGSFLSRISQQTIIKYYKWHMRAPNDCHAVGGYDGGRLLGFCFAGTFRNAEYYFIIENWLFFLKFFIGHPAAFFSREIFIRLKKVSTYLNEYIFKNKKQQRQGASCRSARFGILSIAVDPSEQRTGVGKALMESAEEAARQRGFKKMTLSVNPENQQAVVFYEKNGWIQTKFQNGENWQGTMQKSLVE